MIQQDIQQRAADSGTLLSAAGFTVSLSTINEVVQILAGIVAIISGVCAAGYYIAEHRRKKRGKP